MVLAVRFCSFYFAAVPLGLTAPLGCGRVAMATIAALSGALSEGQRPPPQPGPLKRFLKSVRVFVYSPFPHPSQRVDYQQLVDCRRSFDSLPPAPISTIILIFKNL